MAKWCNDDILDAALDEIADNCNQMTLCNAQPTTRVEATATFAIGTVTMVAGDFTKADGDVSGRKLTIGQKDWMEITATDDGIYLALVDATRLLYVIPATLVSVIDGTYYSVPSWKIEFRDPT